MIFLSVFVVYNYTPLVEIHRIVTSKNSERSHDFSLC